MYIMINTDDKIRGTCTEMCPDGEIKLRETERMLHILEIEAGTETLSKPKADRKRVVKMYSRSAAGSNMSLSENLRTTEALSKTITYLLQDIISSKILPWNQIYDFIADRLLAVRQDMLIQRLPKSECIRLLQPMIRFYAYSAYKLCEHPIEKFDPVINNVQLQECLKKLLSLYDDCDYDLNDCSFAEDMNISNEDCKYIYTNTRPFFEALYITFNLGNVAAICRGLSLKGVWKKDIVKMSLQISVAVLRGNWYRACYLINKLPTLLAAVASLHLPLLRRETLAKMTIAYNSKNLTYPITILQKQLLYSNEVNAINDCIYYGIKCGKDGVRFIRGGINIKEKALVKPRHEKFVSEKLLGKNIAALVLYDEEL